MKTNIRSSRFLLVFAVVVSATLSSCNRGVGCPTNFSLNEILDACVSIAVSIL